MPEKDILRAEFLRRLNRFVGEVKLGDSFLKVHIADTGRLKEILTEGREVYIQKAKNLKTDGKLIAAKMEDGIILLNTSFHPKIAKSVIQDYLFKGKEIYLKSEFRYRGSRIDFLVDGRFLIEVKGCNLKKDELCLFPDAPTSRGVRQINHLVESIEEGYKPILLILAFRECSCFFPNLLTDRNFYQSFKKAVERGLEVRIFKVKVNTDFKVRIDGEIGLCEEKWALQKIYSLS